MWFTTTPFSCSSWSIQNIRFNEQFHKGFFFGRGSATARVLTRGGNEIFGLGGRGCAPFVEESIRRLLRFECARNAASIVFLFRLATLE